MDNNQQPIIPTACFKGKIVLIGVTAHGAADICSTPFSNTEYTVNLHANIIATILSQRFIKEVSKQTIFWVTLCCEIITGLGFSLFTHSLSKILFSTGLIAGYI